jgi:two-component system sensor histidine kinase KdpD
MSVMLAVSLATGAMAAKMKRQAKLALEGGNERERAVLLRAISHDLRTPLSSILGASSAMLEQENPDRETTDRFLKNIKENAEWLIRIVENLLSVTKISDGAIELSKTLEAAEEVAAQAASITRKRFPGRHIEIKGPEELLLVPMDATLVSQAIINLLENAIKNSEGGSAVSLEVEKYGNYARFSVSDSGRGIPRPMLDSLFEPKPPVSEGGFGIGLSICKTIIAAHGGTIEGRNKKEGGAHFCFSLPLK